MKTKDIPFKIIHKNADTLTPVAIFKRLKGERKFLLESSFQHETKGKYSYIGANPYEEIIGRGQKTIIINHRTNERKEVKQNVLKYIKENLPKITIDFPLPFTGGAIGYVGYDSIRQYYAIGQELPDELAMPDAHFMIYEDLIIYEHHNETAHIVAMNINNASDSELNERLQKIEQALDENVTIPNAVMVPVTFKPDETKETFIKHVEQAKQFIEKGEAAQIVLSQRMRAQIHGDPFSFYRGLRVKNPSPYMFYIDFSDYLIIGASPESLVQTTGDTVITNPIAGTRPRGKNDQEDKQLIHDLLSDKKEVNEHDMLVELSKTDLSEICKQDSITVPVYKKIEKYQYVMHIVSEVHGKLKENFSSMDALIACLPAGTVSGSPKLRAMQIINELEEKKRGFYAGGIGYISFNHDINLAIAIRSIVVKDSQAYLQVGAGIVQDSIPEKEYLETLHKAKSLMEVSS